MSKAPSEELFQSGKAGSKSFEGERDMDACSPTVRVLLADDQTLFRVGLARLLESDSRIQIVGEAQDGAEAVRLAGSLKPDVVLMDLKMPNLDGVGATREILA